MPDHARPPVPYLDAPGARRRAAFVLAALPDELAGFVEPLADGGAAAIAVLQARPQVFVTVASEVPGVIDTWNAVRDDAEAVIRALRGFVERHDPDAFRRVRDQDPERLAGWHPADRAARFIYVRGAAHPDASGAPPRDLARAEYGRDAVAVDTRGIRDLHRLLNERDVVLSHDALFAVLAGVRDDDVVYLDSPDAEARDRELARFTAAVAARGARVIAPRPWPALVRLGHDGTDDDPDALWGSRALR